MKEVRLAIRRENSGAEGAEFVVEMRHTAGVKNAGVLFSSFLCLVVTSHADSLARGLKSSRPSRPLKRCELEPLHLPPPATGEQPTPEAEPTPTPAPASQDDRADLDVAGTLARVAPKGKMRVTVWAKNRGGASWTPKDVRIVVRWVDFDAGTRRRWNYNWIKQVVPPKGQFRQALDLAAPPQPGRYKIIYSLVRRSAGGKDGDSPSYDARQDKWPGEFAAVAFAVNVGESSSNP